MIDHLVGFLQIVAGFGIAGVFLIALLEKLVPVMPAVLLYGLMGASASDGAIPIYALVIATAMGSAIGSSVWYVLVRDGTTAVLATIFARFGMNANMTSRQIARIAGTVHGAAFAQILPGVRFGIALIAPSGNARLVRFAAGTFVGALVWSAVMFGLGTTLRAYLGI